MWCGKFGAGTSKTIASSAFSTAALPSMDRGGCDAPFVFSLEELLKHLTDTIAARSRSSMPGRIAAVVEWLVAEAGSLFGFLVPC